MIPTGGRPIQPGSGKWELSKTQKANKGSPAKPDAVQKKLGGHRSAEALKFGAHRVDRLKVKASTNPPDSSQPAKITKTAADKKAWPQALINTKLQAAKLGNLDRLKELHEQDKSWAKEDRTCYEAAANGHLDVLEWAISYGGAPFDASLYEAAGKSGKIEIIEWVLARHEMLSNMTEDIEDEEHSLRWDRAVREDILLGAAMGGHIHILEWAKKMENAPEPEGQRRVGFNWNKGDDILTREAAEHNQFATLKWLHEKQGIPVWTETAAGAAKANNLEMLKWITNHQTSEKKPDGVAFGMDYQVTRNAARNGNIEMLVWALGKGAVIDHLAITDAINKGHLDVLRIALSQKKEDWPNVQIRWESVIEHATENNQLEALKMIQASKMPLDYNKIMETANKNNATQVAGWAKNQIQNNRR